MKYFQKKSIPNYISIFRILLVPVFCFLFLNERYLPAVIVFLIAGLSDISDGMLARKFNWVTDAGKLLDPLADKLMQISVLLCLAIKKFIPIWIIIIITVKEILMIIGASIVLKKKKKYVSSDWFGKTGTVLFYAAVFATVIILNLLPQVFNYVKYFLYLMLLLPALFSLTMYYFRDFRTALDDRK